jgi:chorismate synthase
MEVLGGPLFAVAGAGESHGPAVTTIVFGCPPGLYLRASDIQHYLDRRRPGSNKHGTPRREDDTVALLAGLYQSDHEKLAAGPPIQVGAGDDAALTAAYAEGYTTGEPIAAIVLSTAKKSNDYLQFAGPTGEVRPGHTDLLKHWKSQGFVDVRGGGRSSYRSTISDVIGGSIARLFLREVFGVVILSSIHQVGELATEKTLARRLERLLAAQGRSTLDTATLQAVEQELESAEIHTLDAEFAQEAGQLIKRTRIEGDSLGAALEVVAVNVPPLLGDPLYQSLKLRLMGSLGGLHAVQGVEIGAGFDVVGRRGSQNNDPIRKGGYLTNSHGGLIGGMTTGMPLVLRVGFKPTSTIARQQLSVRKNLEEIDFVLHKGRHDPCVGVRAGVTLESRVAIELMNAVLMHQAQRVDAAQFGLFPRAGQQETGQQETGRQEAGQE